MNTCVWFENDFLKRESGSWGGHWLDGGLRRLFVLMDL